MFNQTSIGTYHLCSTRPALVLTICVQPDQHWYLPSVFNQTSIGTYHLCSTRPALVLTICVQPDQHWYLPSVFNQTSIDTCLRATMDTTEILGKAPVGRTKYFIPLLGPTWPFVYFLQDRLGRAAVVTRSYWFVCPAAVAKHLWCERSVKEVQLTSICYI